MDAITELKRIGEAAKTVTEGINDIAITDDDTRAVAAEVLQEVDKLRDELTISIDARIKELSKELKELKTTKAPIEEGLRVAHNTIKNALSDFDAAKAPVAS